MYGKDFAYASTRIVGTIVRMVKSGEPVFVHSVGANGICSVADIRNFNEQLADVHLDDLDLTPVALGYINCAGQAAYVMRIPVRRGPGNQGLRQENSACSNGRRLFGQPMDALRNCILGKYPSFQKAFTGAQGKAGTPAKTIAFDRHWAIQGEFLLYKNNLVVGSCKKGKPELDERFKYLKESLEEAL